MILAWLSRFKFSQTQRLKYILIIVPYYQEMFGISRKLVWNGLSYFSFTLISHVLMYTWVRNLQKHRKVQRLSWRKQISTKQYNQITGIVKSFQV